MGWVHPHRLLQKAGSSRRLGLAHCFAQNHELMLPFGAHFCFCAESARLPAACETEFSEGRQRFLASS
jgi:hypothetical protein